MIIAAVGALLASSALAAYPGENGKIAFVRGTNSANDDIYAINPDGTGATALTPPEHLDRAPSWSPAGDRIAFHRSQTNGDGTQDVYTMNADGSAPTNLTANAGIRDAWPTWSPDRNRIAFTSDRHPPLGGCVGRYEDVYIMNQDGSAPGRLTGTRHRESQLSWSPRGDEIALHYDDFMYNPADFCAIISQEQGGYTIHPATAARVRDALIDDWSPDGSTYVTGGPGAGYDIWIGGTNVTSTPNVNEVDPAFSPDGRQIVFSTVPHPGDLWVMDADGSNRRQLTATPGIYEYEPDWQPLQRPYPRPKSASPVTVSLVPAYGECTEPNRTHGPPLAHPSCNPPVPASPQLFVGVGDGHPTPARSIGFVRVKTLLGPPGDPDDTDVRMRLRLTNVMNVPDFSDYTGLLRPELTVRLTDRHGFQRQTTQDFPFGFDVPCAATASTTEGALCDLATTADAVVPGSAPEGTRAIWQLDQVKVYDGGPAGDGEDASLFAVQGVFVP